MCRLPRAGIQENIIFICIYKFICISSCISFNICNKGSKDPSMFRSTRIRRASELKAAFLQWEHNFHSASIQELQCKFHNLHIVTHILSYGKEPFQIDCYIQSEIDTVW